MFFSLIIFDQIGRQAFIDHFFRLLSMLKSTMQRNYPAFVMNSEKKNWFYRQRNIFSWNVEEILFVSYNCIMVSMNIQIYLWIPSTKVLGHFRYLGWLLWFEWALVCWKTFSKKRKYSFQRQTTKKIKKIQELSESNILLLSWEYDDVY